MTCTIPATQHLVSEWSLAAAGPLADDAEVDVLITHPDGGTWRVPAFCSGSQEWRVRFAPPLPGRYVWRGACPAGDAGIAGSAGGLEVRPYAGDHPLHRHGALRVAADRRHFAHADGTPFLWLADTWWMALCRRLSWPDDFQALAADRVAKGFTVVQIVAGLYPDMEWYDPRCANEAGHPWDRAFTRLDPGWFDAADLRIQHLVRVGLTPCIVGAWGYFLPWMGVARMRRHWRNLIARWGAYPVTWCLCGEARMPYYLSQTRQQDDDAQLHGWSEIARYVRATDPMRRAITIHPTERGRDQIEDPALIDYEMLQTGHGGGGSFAPSMVHLGESLAREPRMPVLIAEVDYEGFLFGNDAEVQRRLFWGAMLSGAAGHTYGANGIWQVNTREQPYGPSPHGNCWGDRPWDEAMRLPGSAQLGIGKALLMRYRWWEFVPHQEWIEPCAGADDRGRPYASGIPGEVRIIYVSHLVWGRGLRVRGIEPGIAYQARFVDPSSGRAHPLGAVTAEADGSWLVPFLPELRDWLIVLDRSG